MATLAQLQKRLADKKAKVAKMSLALKAEKEALLTLREQIKKTKPSTAKTTTKKKKTKKK